MPHHSRPTGRQVARRATALALVVLALSSCAGTPDKDPADGPTAEDPHLVGHVHGLGIDPADGTVYAAGHFGV